MRRLSNIEWDIIDARVRALKDANNLKTMSLGLLSLVFEQLFPSAQDEFLEAATDGADDRGIDAIHIVEGEQSAEIYLFQAKYRESIETTQKTINDSSALKVSLFIEELFDKAPSLASTNNFRLSENLKRIWALHAKGIICRYRVVFCSNDQGFGQSAISILDTLCAKHDQISYEFYGPSALIRDLTGRGAQRETGSLYVVGKEIFERVDGDVRGMIASVDALSFVDLIRTSDRQSVKRYLFDDNLRVFLGSSGGYNPSIISTATSRDSYLFWYLNNGITITCKNYSFNRSHASVVVRIDDFQIVNGAQTSHSLVEAARLNPEALRDVVLTVRVYATDRSDIAERVAVATNSQARMQGRDLRSNSEVLKRLELALAARGYFFERKKNLHLGKDSRSRIDALKLGQIILSFYLREPDRARAESDAIFDHRFNEVFHEGLDIDELVRVVELYRFIEDLREYHVTQFGENTETGSEYQYLVYGHWFVLFAARLLLIRSESAVPVGSQAKSLVEEALRLVARACSQQKAVAHYQMFRSPKTKEKILAEFSGKQGDLFELLALAE